MKHLLLYEFFSFKFKNETEAQKEIKRPVLKGENIINREIEKIENNLNLHEKYLSLFRNSLGNKKNHYGMEIYKIVLDIFKRVYRLSKVPGIKDRYPKIIEILNYYLNISYKSNYSSSANIFSDICFYVNESYKKLYNADSDILELVSTGFNIIQIRNKKKAEEKIKAKKDIDPMGEEDWGDQN